MNIKDFLKFLMKIIIIDFVSIIIIFLYWFIKGPQNLVHLVDCLSVGGIILMIPGVLVYASPKSISGRNFKRSYISVKETISEDKLKEDKENNLFFRRISIMLLLAGTLLILISLLVYIIG